jgi:hypothetical protein
MAIVTVEAPKTRKDGGKHGTRKNGRAKKAFEDRYSRALGFIAQA